MRSTGKWTAEKSIQLVRKGNIDALQTFSRQVAAHSEMYIADEVRQQAGKARSKEATLQDLKNQEDRAFSGAPSAVDAMGTQTGTKDKYFQHFVDKLQTELNDFRQTRKVPASPHDADSPTPLTANESRAGVLLTRSEEDSLPPDTAATMSRGNVLTWKC